MKTMDPGVALQELRTLVPTPLADDLRTAILEANPLANDLHTAVPGTVPAGLRALVPTPLADDLRTAILEANPLAGDLRTAILEANEASRSPAAAQLGVSAQPMESNPDAMRASARLDTRTHPRDRISADADRAMFGCTATAIDEVLTGKSPRDITMYAMGTLSNAQELIQRSEHEGAVEWTVADQHANTIRQLINIAKYALDKAVPR